MSNFPTSANLRDLELFREHSEYPIVYYRGDYYWISDEDPPSDFQLEDSEIEIALAPTFRSVTGVGNYVPDTPFAEEWLPGLDFTYGIPLDNEGYLPDSKKRAYKVIKNSISAPFIIRQNKENFCVRNGCYDCEHLESCEVEIRRVQNEDRNYNMTVFDISAQEPVLLTFLSREPNYLAVFRNRHLRAAGLLDNLDEIYKNYYNVDPNTLDAFHYWTWVDMNFHHNFDSLVEFNFLIERYNQGDDSVKGKILEYLETWLESLQKYLDSK